MLCLLNPVIHIHIQYTSTDTQIHRCAKSHMSIIPPIPSAINLEITLYTKIFRPHNNLTLVFYASAFLLLSIDFISFFYSWYREQSKQLNDEVKLNDGMATEHINLFFIYFSYYSLTHVRFPLYSN